MNARVEPSSLTSNFDDQFWTASGDFDEWKYLFHNPDVALDVRSGKYLSGHEHYMKIGRARYIAEKRQEPSTREMSYLLRNPDVKAAVEAGAIQSGRQHWETHGRNEERAGARKPYISGASQDVSEFDLSTWRDGYVVLPNMFSVEQCDSIIAETDRLWRDRRNVSQDIAVDIWLNTEKADRVHISEVTPEAYNHPFKINDLFFYNPVVRGTVLDERLSRVLRHLLDGDPTVLTTLNFRKGSEQGLHLDTFYMPPALPHRMVAAWIALEDTTDDNGALQYIPGSNRIPPYYFDGHRLRVDHSDKEYKDFSAYFGQKMEQYQLQPKKFYAKKGDVFIWHALLCHGGSPIANKDSTRESLVAHYFSAADYPGGTCSGSTTLIEHGEGRYYEDRAPSVRHKNFTGFSF
jgi:ectoine hydroxylase-related dioxygenase (phytanoyl-CoA dioxygenase family)